MIFRQLLSSLLLVSFTVAACDASPESGQSGTGDQALRYHFQAPSAGKADGVATGLLAPTELAQIQGALEAAIAATETRIAKLETDIAKLESDSNKKLAEINSLLSQIESRKRAIESNLKAKQASAFISGIFGFFFPPAWIVTAASVAAAIADDSEIKSLQGKLSKAKTDRDALAAQRADYVKRRDSLRAELVPLRAAKVELVALLGSSPPAFETVSERPEGASVELDALAWRVRVMRQVLANNNAQIAILTKLRALAVDFSSAVDAALKTVRDLAAAADQMLAESNAAFDELVALALSGDPLAAAQAWLERILAAKTKALLDYYDWPVAGFVDFLIDHRDVGLDAVVAELRAELIEAITDAVVDGLLAPGARPEPATELGTGAADDVQCRPCADDAACGDGLTAGCWLADAEGIPAFCALDCTSSDACPSGSSCQQDPGASYKTCIPDAWSCEGHEPATDPDTGAAGVDPGGVQCRPCTDDAACGDGSTAGCWLADAEGIPAFCALDCTSSDACPSGSSCQQDPGAPYKTCIPDAWSCEGR